MKDNPIKGNSIKDKDQKALEFAAYLKEKMERHQMTASQLADVIGTARKSVYRYIKGENGPTPKIEAIIREYFADLEQNQKVDAAIQEALDNEMPEEDIYLMLADLNMEEADEAFEDALYQEIVKGHRNLFDRISVYNQETQRYILRYFEEICMLTKEDILLVRRINLLKADRYREVIDHLERIPLKLEMLLADTEEPMQLISGLLRMIQSDEVVPTNKYGEVASEGKGRVFSEIQQGLYNKIDDLMRIGFEVPENLDVQIKAALNFAVKDWYLLFLYERLRRQDRMAFNWTSYTLEDQQMGEQEYLFRIFLKMVEKR